MQQDEVSSALAAAREQEAEPYFGQAGDLIRSGHMDAALEQLERAVACSPRTARYVAAMGVVLFQLNRAEDSEKTLRRAQELAPGDLEITGNLGLVLRHRGFHDEALPALRMVVAGGRGTPKIFEQLGLELIHQGRINNAEQVLNKVLKAQPENATALTAMGRIRAMQGDDAAAEVFWQRMHSESADIHTYRAQQQIMSGRMDTAVATIEEALLADPKHAPALFLWTHVADGEDSVTFSRERIDAMISGALADPAVTNDDWLNLKFAAGKLNDATQDYDEAFAHYDAANRNVWARQFIPRNFYDDSVGAILDVFDDGFFEANRTLVDREPKGKDRAGEGLVFVFGMPRSGTTLIEQILARDSAVMPGGERNDMENLAGSLRGEGHEFPEAARHLSLATVRQVAGAHHDQVRKIAGKNTCFTDKMPRNFMYVGLLHILFPRARFVNCVRDPMDTCLSCYFNYFVYGSIKNSYNLEMLGHFFNHYQRMMEHWHAVLPGTVQDVRYEDLVSDPERIIRELVVHCDLPWGDHFLAQPANRHMVSTASVAQVRKPIHQRAVGRWQAYEKHLEPLRKILEIDGK
jgi:tetratricopeptide (TPR) repeat protein